MKKVKKKRREHFNDLLLPIIFVLCVMPFVVFLAEYDYGYHIYAWHSDNSVMQDFYTYYRSRFFLVIVFFAIVILAFRLWLYKEKTKPVKAFLPLVCYSAFVFLSAICSRHPKAAWLGNFVTLEGAFVLVGYCVMAFYAYQIMEGERDYQSVMYAIWVMFLLISVTGWFQVFRKDLLNDIRVQRLVMPDHLFEVYGGEVGDVFTGNNVFLTLYNPNYAAVFLVMFAAVFSVFLLWAKEGKERLLYGFLLADDLILCWFTYTRAALAALAVIAVLLAVGRKEKNGREKWFFPAAAALFVLLFALDAANGGKYLGRLLDQKKSNALEAIVTTQTGVQIKYSGETYLFAIEEQAADVSGTGTDREAAQRTAGEQEENPELRRGEEQEENPELRRGGEKEDALVLRAFDGEGNLLELAEAAEGGFVLPFSETSYVNVIEWEDCPNLIFLLENNTLQFAKRETGYYYETEWGKEDLMTEIPHVDFGGYEYLGSGRLYIWSRILPMLKRYLFVGSGPDTFAEVFPQNDYAGKLIYAETTARIMERAHNDYLMRWVQTGMLSVVSLLVFYGLLVKKAFPFYRNCELTGAKEKLGFGCFLGCIGYLVCCFFSDSTIYTTPTFYVFMGMTLAAAQGGMSK